MSVSELDGWKPVAPPRRPRSPRARRAIAAGVSTVTVGLLCWYGVWAFTGVHGGGPVAWEDTGHNTACAPDPLEAPGDLTMVLPVGTLLQHQLLEARLIGAHGLSLVEADLGTLGQGPNGDYVLPPVNAGWPALDRGTVVPGSLIPAVGAAIGGFPQVLVLHLHVDDPAVESGFQDVGLIYRAGMSRYELRLEYTQRLVPGDQVCVAS
jgi:hypothetical protein